MPPHLKLPGSAIAAAWIAIVADLLCALGGLFFIALCFGVLPYGGAYVLLYFLPVYLLLLLLFIGQACAAVGVLRQASWAGRAFLLASGVMVTGSLVATLGLCLFASYYSSSPYTQTPEAKSELFSLFFFLLITTLLGLWWIVLFRKLHVLAAFSDCPTTTPSGAPAKGLPPACS